MEIKLNIYDENDEKVVRTAVVQPSRIMSGSVRKLMKLVKIEDADNKKALLKLVANAWDQVEKVLGGFFPDITEEEWDHVDMGELISIIPQLLNFAISEMLHIPVDEKNA